MAEQGVAFHLLAQLQSVDSRHHQVGDDDVGDDIARLLQSFIPVAGHEQGVVAMEQRTDIAHHVVVVLDDEHAFTLV